MASPPSAYDEQTLNLPPMFHLLFARKLALEESQSTFPDDVTYDIQEFQTSIFICIVGLTLFFIFYRVLDGFHDLLRNETFEHDIELGDIANPRSLLLGILNGFMEFLADKGPSPEDLENAMPLVNYKSLGKPLDVCVICLEDFEDDELCRVFPVCKHIFHSSCIDKWLTKHSTCPICRECIVDL